MSRLIDVDALKAFHDMANDCKDCKQVIRSCQYDTIYSKMDFCSWLDDAPTVDAVPVVHGRWKSRFEGRLHYCSKCGWALMYTQGGEPPYMGDGYNRDNEERWLCRPGWCEDAMRYCPQCGAKMDGKDGDDHES